MKLGTLFIIKSPLNSTYLSKIRATSVRAGISAMEDKANVTKKLGPMLSDSLMMASIMILLATVTRINTARLFRSGALLMRAIIDSSVTDVLFPDD